MIFRTILIVLLVIIFILTILFVLYKIFHKKIDMEYQQIIKLNNFGLNVINSESKCPSGCEGKVCKFGSKCYNCDISNPNPNCCCFDSQCKDC